jgi:hypothetical protein
VVLVLLNLLLKLNQRDLLVLNNQVDLKLLDTETDSDKLRSTPNKTVLLDGEDIGLELVQVGFIIYIWLSL